MASSSSWLHPCLVPVWRLGALTYLAARDLRNTALPAPEQRVALAPRRLRRAAYTYEDLDTEAQLRPLCRHLLHLLPEFGSRKLLYLGLVMNYPVVSRCGRRKGGYSNKGVVEPSPESNGIEPTEGDKSTVTYQCGGATRV
ncbi:hypothetical protein K438DRAFT_1766468 [Mycena galopus ATCC 62051]|nr:hypothetical protein K438DRAFT_1776735 [Mycena galopus ATCC 62051]KAF8184017.1 hypothetical protein K438DRAFT_1766468 [Mycena galopus ATCC 62051]